MYSISLFIFLLFHASYTLVVCFIHNILSRNFYIYTNIYLYTLKNIHTYIKQRMKEKKKYIYIE